MFLCRLCGNTFDADRKLCGRTLADSRTPAKRIPPRTLPIWELSSEAFLVYIAAVLFYEPIFTQPLGFVPCTAGAVEKFATDGAVSVRSTGSEVVLPQKRRSIFCPIASRCGCIRPAFSAGWGRPVRGNAVSFRLRPDQGKGWRGIQPVCAAAWRGTGR